MEYNVYVKTTAETYNIKYIQEANLAKLVDAYNIGKDSTFLNGKKYELANLEEIKIYTLDNPAGFNDFINTPESKSQIKWGKYGLWLSPHMYRNC